MTHRDFQDDLVCEVTKLLKDVVSKNTAGETVVGVQGYKHFLPIITEEDEDESQFFPYFIVRLSEGKTETDDEPWVDAVDILFGVVNHSKKHEGAQEILHMIQIVTDRFAEEPLLCKKYRAEQDIEWAVSDEDTYPFFFGGIRIKFSVPKIGRRTPSYEDYI